MPLCPVSYYAIDGAHVLVARQIFGERWAYVSAMGGVSSDGTGMGVPSSNAVLSGGARFRARRKVAPLSDFTVYGTFASPARPCVCQLRASYATMIYVHEHFPDACLGSVRSVSAARQRASAVVSPVANLAVNWALESVAFLVLCFAATGPASGVTTRSDFRRLCENLSHAMLTTVDATSVSAAVPCTPCAFFAVHRTGARIAILCCNQRGAFLAVVFGVNSDRARPLRIAGTTGLGAGAPHHPAAHFAVYGIGAGLRVALLYFRKGWAVGASVLSVLSDGSGPIHRTTLTGDRASSPCAPFRHLAGFCTFLVIAVPFLRKCRACLATSANSGRNVTNLAGFARAASGRARGPFGPAGDHTVGWARVGVADLRFKQLPWRGESTTR